MKLTLVETAIGTDGLYREESTIRVTAVDANHATVPGFTGTVSIVETSAIRIYNQSLGFLPSGVTISSGGTVTFVAKSFAGPKVSGTGGVKPDPATIKTGNYPVDGGVDLSIPQWIVSDTTNGRIDPHSTGEVYDWFQSRTRDIFAQATGDGAAVLSTIGSYSLNGNLPEGIAGEAVLQRAPTSSVQINPFFSGVRRDTPEAGTTCGFPVAHALTNILYHEARHTYQGSLTLLTGGDIPNGDDADGDFLVNKVPIAPIGIIRDTTAPRDVCNEFADTPNQIILGKTYKGDTMFDTSEAPDFASYAREMDAHTFASNH